MMRFAIALDHDVLTGPAGLQPLEQIAAILTAEPQSIALDLPVEAPAADEAGPAKAATVARLSVMYSIEARPHHNQNEECNSKPTERPAENTCQRAATIYMDTKPARETFRPEQHLADNDAAL
jgi:hypothetical protein